MRPSLAILLGLVLFPLAVPLPASAQLDSRCFTRSECMVKRQAFLVEAGQTDETLAEGFVVNAETKTACGERIGEGEGNELGFCLPAGKTTTKIGFAGQRDFTNIGQFIQYMYRFGIV
ncbi:MAG TPA: hypothetical protein VEA18_00495, partial [Candidatus Kapabacteria bacterium]|nr:hypothetical protein [Candidatus Kapabacteria bacterium]